VAAGKLSPDALQGPSGDDVGDGHYHGSEEQTRLEIDRQLDAAGWVVHRATTWTSPRGWVSPCAVDAVSTTRDYLLVVDGRACGVIE
jgi:type I site-specific restriction endonuclease